MATVVRRGPHDLVGHTGERGRDPGEQVHKGRSFSRSLNGIPWYILLIEIAESRYLLET